MSKLKQINSIFKDVKDDDVHGFRYIPTPTGLLYHESDKFLKGVRGPFGSGKSCMVVNDILFNCMAQNVHTDGVRYSHVGVIRGTYPELISTTRNSILEVFSSSFGSINVGGAPLTGTFRMPVGDGPYDWITRGEPWKPGYGTLMEITFTLQALQDPWDKEKIKSANWSFAWINEATGVDPEIIEAVAGRVGRFPTEGKGGCRWRGILMDFNQPARGTRGEYLLDWMENPEDNWEFFTQPPAVFRHEDEFGNVDYEVNPNAENLSNLSGGVDYYTNQIAFYKKSGEYDRIDSLFCMQDVKLKEGKPVWPSFNRKLHVAQEVIEPLNYSPVIIGYDTSGIHPAAVLIQHIQGRWVVTDELYGDGMGLEAFVEQGLIPLLSTKYPNCSRIASCDPANAKDSYTAMTPADHLRQNGFEVFLPKTNSPRTRITCVEHLLNKNFGGITISPNCELLISAMEGGYKYKKLRLSGSMKSTYDNKPEKNEHSHIADALQYGCMYLNRGASLSEEKSLMAARLAETRSRLRKIM